MMGILPEGKGASHTCLAGVLTPFMVHATYVERAAVRLVPPEDGVGVQTVPATKRMAALGLLCFLHGYKDRGIGETSDERTVSRQPS